MKRFKNTEQCMTFSFQIFMELKSSIISEKCAITPGFQQPLLGRAYSHGHNPSKNTFYR